MIVRKYMKRHNASFLRLVRSMADERWVYDAIDYQLMDMYYYEDYILMSEDYLTLVAENSTGDVIGFCVGSIRHDSVDIKILFVSKDQRRYGFGRLLKKQMTKYACELGKKSITAHNSYSNPISLKLNNSLGWTITPISGGNLTSDFLPVLSDDIETDYYKAELVFGNKTIKEWDEMSGITILDPDGFDRSDPYLHLRRFSAQEYIDKGSLCTIRVNDIEMNIAFIKQYIKGDEQ